jgi:integrase
MSDQLHLLDPRIEPRSAVGDKDLLARFGAYLQQRGHRPETGRAYCRAVSHFLGWLDTNDTGLGALLGPDAVRRFLEEHLPTCTCPPPVVRSPHMLRAALNQLLSMAGQPRLMPQPPPVGGAIETAVRAFDHFLQEVCGLAEQTRVNRCRYVRQFLSALFGAGPIDVERITPVTLIDYVTDWAGQTQPLIATAMVGALRSYLRFLHFDGQLRENFGAAIPAPACRSSAGVPPALGDADLARFWSVFDRSTPIGKRDYAIARCLADMALRCHEVAELTLEAIDWRAGVLTLFQTKHRRCDRLPLPPTTGEALVDYLGHGRPVSGARAVFLHHRAPRGAAVAKTTVRGAVRRAFRRAELPWTGTHVLRHSAARRMLEGDCSLKEIADVLRHRSIDTTAIYTKVDLPQLRRVALPWPEVRP